MGKNLVLRQKRHGCVPQGKYGYAREQEWEQYGLLGWKSISCRRRGAKDQRLPATLRAKRVDEILLPPTSDRNGQKKDEEEADEDEGKDKDEEGGLRCLFLDFGNLTQPHFLRNTPSTLSKRV